jgi:hypothetical protein
VRGDSIEVTCVPQLIFWPWSRCFVESSDRTAIGDDEKTPPRNPIEAKYVFKTFEMTWQGVLDPALRHPILTRWSRAADPARLSTGIQGITIDNKFSEGQGTSGPERPEQPEPWPPQPEEPVPQPPQPEIPPYGPEEPHLPPPAPDPGPRPDPLPAPSGSGYSV